LKVISLIIRVRFSFVPAEKIKLFFPPFLAWTFHLLFFFGCINKRSLGYLQAPFFLTILAHSCGTSPY
jgi:membrane protein CcdC involved in cytochrome C biogenesis